MSTLVDAHDVILLDLDGTVYRGGQPVPQARESIDRIHGTGIAIRYVTNNASRSPHEVADQLTALGLPAKPAEICTSAQAGAALLANRLPAGARVLVVGTEALTAAVGDVGLKPVRQYEQQPSAVVQGHSPATGWNDLAEACLAIRDGALWVACNGDFTLPTERGELPGNGAMVAALQAATGDNPIVAGKPERPLLDRAIASAGGGAPLIVGDRLDTDIKAAVRAGLPALLVLTGVSTPTALLSAGPDRRPDYVAHDLSALHRPAAEAAIQERPSWQVRSRGSSLELAASADADADTPLSALHALCTVWWSLGGGPVEVTARDPVAATALRKLELA